MKAVVLALGLLLAVLGTTMAETNALDIKTGGVNLRRLQEQPAGQPQLGTDNQPVEPPAEQPMEEPQRGDDELPAGMPMDDEVPETGIEVDDLEGLPDDEAPTEEDKRLAPCFPGSRFWPRCRLGLCFPGSPIWPRCRWIRPPRCVPGSPIWPRCRWTKL